VTTDMIRSRIAIAIAAVALVVGLGAALFGTYDSGIRWRVDAGRLIVDEVDRASPAAHDGVSAGMIAIDFNNVQLIALPEVQYGDPGPSAEPDAPPPIIGTVPAVPTNRGLSDVELSNLSLEAIQTVTLIRPENLAAGTPGAWAVESFFYPGGWDYQESGFALLPGIAVLLLGGWWLQTGRGGPSLQPIGLPLAVAASVPLLVVPLGSMGPAWAVIAAGIITLVAMLPLALCLAERIVDVAERNVVFVVIAVFVVAATMLTVGLATGTTMRAGATLYWVLTGGIPLLPGVIAAGPINFDSLKTGVGRGAGGLLQSTELALAGATPLFAVGTDHPPYIWPLALWLTAIALAGRFTVRPLARLATRATLQRDLVVAATEAERARLAADIHDDALQELTLLVRRLEASGDTEGAEIGRTVADRLRAICGDLRLPILDDLGVGPALDWLVLRIERLAGGEVRLERDDDARHSADVELAIFRVAQEALANAVKHGKPPIVVRYRSTPGGISLAIDDAGPGITDQAPGDAEKAGRFGLLNMAQRAEQIGAILDVKRWPTGGTHVALEWRPR
jgi:signal transduction histidine kinase